MSQNLTELKKSDVISAMFLVAGTCIGGGMLALPIGSGASGFFPSFIIMLLCWVFMSATGLLLVEISLWFKEESHVMSMATKFLGLPGMALCWLLYLFVSYGSLVAYGAGGGVQVGIALDKLFNIQVPEHLAIFFFITFFAATLYLGAHLVGRVNAILFVGAAVAYVWLLALGIPEVNLSLLSHVNWSKAPMALPLILTSFSFQTMAPSLTPILKREPNAIRAATLGGTTITLIVYALWQFVILGIVPVEGKGGIIEALVKGDEPATAFLKNHVGGFWIAYVAEFFGFFAIVTSFLGMALGLFDFLADGLKIKKKGFGNLGLGILIILPTWFFASYFERVFLLALDMTGGYGDTILNGLIPVAMVWVGRYHMKQSGPMRLLGGKWVLTIIALFYMTCLSWQIASQFGLVKSIHNAYEIKEIHNIEDVLHQDDLLIE